MGIREICWVAAGLWVGTGTVVGQEHEALSGMLQVRLDSLINATRIPGATLGVALRDGTSLGLASGWSDTIRAEPWSPITECSRGASARRISARWRFNSSMRAVWTRRADLRPPG